MPPMMQMKNLQQISYVRNMLPELIWIGLINSEIDYIPAARLLETVTDAFKVPQKDETPFNHAIASCYSRLEESQKQDALTALDRTGLLREIRELISPITVLFDASPLHFFGAPEKPKSKDVLTKQLSSCVGACIDKFETPGIMLHGAMLLARLKAGTIFFPKDMNLPDFDSVIRSPGSEEASRAAGFLRANAIGEFGMLDLAEDWPREFWNKSFGLEKCSIPENIDE